MRKSVRYEALRVAVFAGLAICAATGGSVQAQTSRTTSRATKAPDYERLRRSYKVNPRITLATVQADAASHTGRVIELQGTITGIMTVQNVRTVLMQVDNTTLALPVSQTLNEDAVRSGASVRALALIGKNVERNEAVFTLVAVTDQPEVAKVIDTGSATLSTPPPPPANNTQLSAGDVIISPEIDAPAPPMTSMQQVLPQAPGSRPSIVQAPGGAASGSDFNAGSGWDNQKAVFRNTVRQFNKKLTPAQANEIANAIVDAGRTNGMDPRFLAAIIAVESDFDIYCLSRSGAMGLGQIMPFNMKEAGITNAWNPTQNIFGTARLLRGHLNSYRDRTDGTLLAVAAYNAGPGAVRRAGYRVPAGAQVQRYVWKVYYQYKAFAPDMFR